MFKYLCSNSVGIQCDPLSLSWQSSGCSRYDLVKLIQWLLLVSFFFPMMIWSHSLDWTRTLFGSTSLLDLRCLDLVLFCFGDGLQKVWRSVIFYMKDWWPWEFYFFLLVCWILLPYFLENVQPSFHTSTKHTHDPPGPYHTVSGDRINTFELSPSRFSKPRWLSHHQTRGKRHAPPLNSHICHFGPKTNWCMCWGE